MESLEVIENNHLDFDLPPSDPPDYSSLNSEDSEDDDSEGEVPDLPEFIQCTGQAVTWLPGSIWDTYAYQQHDSDTIPWFPIGMVDTTRIILRSKRCKKKLDVEDSESETCSQCRQLLNSAALHTFMKRATGSVASTVNWKYLTTRQLRKMLSDSRTRGQALKLKILNYQRKEKRLRKKLPIINAL